MTWIPEIETLADAPGYHAARRPDEIALVDGARMTSWRAFEERTSRVANGLLAMGIAPGDRVAAIDQNSRPVFRSPLRSRQGRRSAGGR